MKLNISATIDNGAQHKLTLFTDFSNSLKNSLNKDYGNDLNEISIHCFCANPSKEFEHFYKIKKPKYVANKLIKNKYTGESLLLEKVFMYDIKIDNQEYEVFINTSDEESKKILAIEILKSLENLNKLPKTVEFNKEQFIKDVEFYFREQDLI